MARAWSMAVHGPDVLSLQLEGLLYGRFPTYGRSEKAWAQIGPGRATATGVLPQRFGNDFWMAERDRDQRLRSSRRLAPPLLPFLKGARRDAQRLCKLCL